MLSIDDDCYEYPNANIFSAGMGAQLLKRLIRLSEPSLQKLIDLNKQISLLVHLTT